MIAIHILSNEPNEKVRTFTVGCSSVLLQQVVIFCFCMLFIEEERYLESILNKKKINFHHFEEKLIDTGKTVVIWCLRDFLRNKRYVLLYYSIRSVLKSHQRNVHCYVC